MGSWKINPQQLRQELQSLLGDACSEEQMQLGLRLADRISRSQGKAPELDSAELSDALRDALFAFQNGRPHFLNLSGNRPAVSATIVALQKLTSTTSWSFARRSLPVPDIGQHLATSSDNWAEFLQAAMNGDHGGIRSLWNGIAEFTGVIRHVGFDFLIGGAHLVGLSDHVKQPSTLFGNGETVDTSLHVVLTQALTVFGEQTPVDGDKSRIIHALGRRMDRALFRYLFRHGVPSEEIQKKMRNEFANRGLEEPPSFEEVMASVHHIREASSEFKQDSDWLLHIEAVPQFKQDVRRLLIYLSAYAGEPVETQAAEALLLLDAGVYHKRKRAPLGTVTRNFPKIDGTDREAVLNFLANDLQVPFANDDQKQAVWEEWIKVWNDSDISADDLLMDLDKTTYMYKFQFPPYLSGIETVRLRPVWIMLVALALRDQKAIRFKSHTMATRAVDIFNHPAMAPLKFAFFLRLPKDPLVTIAELERSNRHMVFEELTAVAIRHFKDAAGSNPSPALLLRLSHLLEIMQGGISRTRRGPKDLHAFGDLGKEPLTGREVLFDDTGAQVDAYVISGGKAVAVQVKPGNGLQTFYEALKAAKLRDPKQEGVKLVCGESFADLERLPQISGVVNHRSIARWGRHCWDKWARPMGVVGYVRGKAEKALIAAARKAGMDLKEHRRTGEHLAMTAARLLQDPNANGAPDKKGTSKVASLGLVAALSLPSVQERAEVVRPVIAASGVAPAPVRRVTAFPTGFGLLTPRMWPAAVRLAGR